MSTLICPNCNCIAENGEAFCSKCGTKLEEKTLCLACGKELKPDEEFCTQCGAKRNTSKSQIKDYSTISKILPWLIVTASIAAGGAFRACTTP